jgi:hypothetical protein
VKTIKEYVHRHSIENLGFGKIIAKEGDLCTIRIGTRVITANFADGIIGQTVSLQYPDGDISKGYIVTSAPVIIGEGGIVEI